MRQAIDEATTLARLDGATLAKVGAVFNAVLNRPDREIKIRGIIQRRGIALPLLVASRGRPAAKTVARTLFAYTEVMTMIGAPLAKRQPDEDAESHAADRKEGGTSPEPADLEEASTAAVEPHFPPSENPLVRLGEVPPAQSSAQFYEGIVDYSAEEIAMLARHRAELPWRGRIREERRILEQADAICAAGGDCVKRIAAWWMPVRPSPDPWRAWAAIFALSSLEGPDAMDAVGRGLERLPADARDAATTAAEALVVAPHSEVLTLANDLLVAPHPLARAVAIDVVSSRGALQPEALDRHLWDVNAPVLVAALHALPRVLTEATPLVAHVVRLTGFPNPSVAWAAARALARWGRPEPLLSLRRSERIATTLAPLDALELLVLLGDASDVPLFEAILSRCVVTPAHLSALGRFGHAASAAFLLHHLADEDLADAAASALETMLGKRVAPDETRSPAAWQSALEKMEVDLDVRYRLGEPWRASLAAGECLSGELPFTQMQRRLDELAARSGVRTKIDLRLWSGDIGAPLANFLNEVTRSTR